MNLKEAFTEISEYLDINVEEILNKYEEISKKYEGHSKWRHITEEEFMKLKINNKNIKELRDFYSKTENYIFELMEYHSTEAKHKMRRRCIEILKNYNIKNVLDYGCGVGQDSIEAAIEGIHSVAFDIPGKTLDFARWRIKERNLNIDVVEIKSDEPLIDSYKAIMCFEVVNVTVDPVKTVKHLYEHLDKNGILLITARFKDNYKLVPEYNIKCEENFYDLIQDIGFELLHKEHMWGPENNNGKYLYVYKKS